MLLPPYFVLDRCKSCLLRWLFYLLFWSAAIGFVLEGFTRHTPSNDEWVQHIYGQLLWDFYLSGLTDRTFLHFSNLFLYGGLFDLIAAAGTRFAAWPWWPWRHLLSALFGLLALAGTMRLARYVTRTRSASWLAGLLLMTTGVFWGAIFTHTKDIPFAAAMVWALYYALRTGERFPEMRQRHLLLLGIAFGCALGLRVAALFVPLFGLIAHLAASWSRQTLPFTPLGQLPRALGQLIAATLLAGSIAAFAWPWSVMGADHLFKAIETFSRFSFYLHTWENGDRILNADVSRTYLHHYLVVRLPEALLIGVILLGVGALQRSMHSKRLWALAGGVAGILIYVALKKPPLYNGLRHFLFLVPPVAALAAAGWIMGLKALQRHLRSACWALAAWIAALTATLIPTIWELIRLHPYEHLFYNRLVGGVAGAQFGWETDYWNDAVGALLAPLNEWVAQHAPYRTVHLAFCGEPFQIEVRLPANVLLTEDWRDAELFLASTHDQCHLALAGEEIARIERAGAVLAVLQHLSNASQKP